MNNKYGMYIQQPGMGTDLLKRWKPGYTLLMDASSDDIRKAKEASPKTKFLYRKYEDNVPWYDRDPIQWAREIWDLVQHCPPHIVISYNEPFGHDQVQVFADFDRWQEEFALWWKAKGVEVGGFNFGEGNWTKDGPGFAEYFPRSLRVIRYIILHEYGWPSMFDGEGYQAMEGYHTMRWPYILKDLEDHGYDDKLILIGECGLTRLVAGGPDHGWQSGGYIVTDETYVADLRRYHAEICQEPKVVAALPFVWYAYGDYGTFDHINRPEVVEAIINMECDGPTPEPPPPPETPEEDDMVRFYDQNDIERDEDWARSEYGFHMVHAVVAAGQSVFRLVEVREVEGMNTHITSLHDPDGKPLTGEQVAFYWPDAPPLPQVYSHDHYPKAHLGPINADGNCGNGMGRGAYMGKGECGPHAVWIHHPTILSDAHLCIGMRAGSNHKHLQSIFELRTEGGAPTPPSSDGEGQFGEVSRSCDTGVAKNELVIEFSGRSEIDLRGELDVQDWDDPDGPPAWELETPIHPTTKTLFVFDTTYERAEGEPEERIFRAYIRDLAANRIVGGPFAATFRERHVCKWTIWVKWQEEEEPGPEPDASLSEMFDQIGDTFKAIGARFREIGEL